MTDSRPIIGPQTDAILGGIVAKTVGMAGNKTAGIIYVPKSWVGKEVYVVLKTGDANGP